MVKRKASVSNKIEPVEEFTVREAFTKDESLSGDSDSSDVELNAEESSDEDEEFEDAREEIQENELDSSDSDGDSDKNSLFSTWSDGTNRKILPEIDPVYDSDDTDQEEPNTIGEIPISAYEKMPHIGYDIDGKRIMRPATASALDSLLETIDLPEGWTGLLDKSTGEGLKLSEEELDLIKKLQLGENADDAMNPYEDTVEWFTSKTMETPLRDMPEPKRRFVPSKHEAKKVMKIVRAIRSGQLVLGDKAKKDLDAKPLFDVWADSTTDHVDDVMTLRAPKLPPPTHEESYNPPEEYLMTEEERKEWEETDPSERTRNFIPQKYSSLRTVPGYSNSVKERFERSLDLYLAPRYRRKQLNVDPDSLIPELPSPQDLRPFPIKCATVYSGHEGRVRSVSIDATGQFLATSGDDGTARIWDVISGRELWKISVSKADAYQPEDEDDDFDDGSKDGDDKTVFCVQWNPVHTGVLAIVASGAIYLTVPPFLFDVEKENESRDAIAQGFAYAQQEAANTKAEHKKKLVSKWTAPGKKLSGEGVGVVIRSPHTVKSLSWHRKGDYFVTVAPDAANKSVLVHQLSKHSSQSPFKKSKGLVQDAKFHPFRPQLYVATQRYVRVYDLAAQVMERKIHPGSRWVSKFDIHPRGDNVLTGSFDKKVTWHDQDLSNKPYKTLRYHDKAVRDVAFHKLLPLFCTAADDGNINVFHGAVYDDMMKNPLLVPLKVLKGHKVTQALGVLNVAWHPREAWLFSGGADGTARLWVA